MKKNKHVITATIYDRSGKVLSRAVNNYTRSHPIQARFAKAAGQPERIYLHAELAALVKLKAGKPPYSIYVERYTKDKNPANAAPCSVCVAALKFYGIRVITHTV